MAGDLPLSGRDVGTILSTTAFDGVEITTCHFFSEAIANNNNFAGCSEMGSLLILSAERWWITAAASSWRKLTFSAFCGHENGLSDVDMTAPKRRTDAKGRRHTGLEENWAGATGQGGTLAAGTKQVIS
jgi:hypothetical protein